MRHARDRVACVGGALVVVVDDRARQREANGGRAGAPETLVDVEREGVGDGGAAGGGERVEGSVDGIQVVVVRVRTRGLTAPALLEDVRRFSGGTCYLPSGISKGFDSLITRSNLGYQPRGAKPLL